MDGEDGWLWLRGLHGYLVCAFLLVYRMINMDQWYIQNKNKGDDMWVCVCAESALRIQCGGILCVCALSIIMTYEIAKLKSDI